MNAPDEPTQSPIIIIVVIKKPELPVLELEGLLIMGQ
jgi:hypothetical protein